MGTALKDFFKENELPKAVRLGVSNQQIVVRQIDLPKIEGDKELDAAIRFQAPESIAMPLDDAVLDWQVIGETVGDEGAPRLKVVLVAARRSMVANLLHAVRSAGLKPQSVDLDAFALVRMLASPDAHGEEAQVYCHLGALTNLALAVGSSCIFTRALSTTLDGDPELDRGGARRRDPPLDRLLHGTARRAAGERDRDLGTGRRSGRASPTRLPRPRTGR